jgi:group I intron endonuclease
MNGIIYKVTNIITGHSYFGLTIKTLKERKKLHLKNTFSKCSPEYNYVFHCAIRRYGLENFKWEEWESGIDNFELLKEREIYNIKKYKTFYKNKNGYNMTMGGDGCFGWRHSDESREKMKKNHADVRGEKNPMYGIKRYLSDETKEKISNSIKELYSSGKRIHHQLNKPVSEKTKRKISKSLRKRYV